MKVNSKYENERIKKFEDLFREFFKPLVLFSKKYVKSEEIAKDVVSDVFFNLWNYKTDFEEVKDIKTYLYKASKNQCLRYIEKNVELFHIEGKEFSKDFAIENFNPENELRYNELRKKLDEVVENLPPKCKIIFKHLKEDGLKYHEVAEILDISKSAVKKQLVKAMERIRACIADHFNEDQHKAKEPSKIISIKSLFIFFSFFFG